jgi:hypothetical protein
MRSLKSYSNKTSSKAIHPYPSLCKIMTYRAGVLPISEPRESVPRQEDED